MVNNEWGVTSNRNTSRRDDVPIPSLVEATYPPPPAANFCTDSDTDMYLVHNILTLWSPSTIAKTMEHDLEQDNLFTVKGGDRR